MKTSLREKCDLSRKNIPDVDSTSASTGITKQLLEFDLFKNANVIHCYISTDSEVSTLEILNSALISGKKVLVPAMAENGEMRSSELSSLDNLVENNLKFKEPCEKKYSDSSIDLVIVPGVAFDRTGNRLGRGGGYYDKFLAGANATKIGLAFSSQIVDDVPVEAHDVPVDYVITENERINCNDSKNN